MSLLVLIRIPLFPFVTNKEKASKPTGIAHIIANKGGVCVAFRLFNTSFFFVNCHLDAKASRVKERIQSYQKLTRSLRTGHTSLESISLYDHVFFLGDFNFRVQRTFESTVQMATDNKISEILSYDQML